jgi:hypothetical protein
MKMREESSDKIFRANPPAPIVRRKFIQAREGVNRIAGQLTSGAKAVGQGRRCSLTLSAGKIVLLNWRSEQPSLGKTPAKEPRYAP